MNTALCISVLVGCVAGAILGFDTWGDKSVTSAGGGGGRRPPVLRPAPATRPARPADAGGHPPPRPGEVRELAITRLGNFTYDPVRGGDVPADVTALDGTTVRLTGFMMPSYEVRELKTFDLVPSLRGCCFGQAPGVRHTVTVVCEPGRPVMYSPEPVAVEGTLAVREIRDGGYVVSLFQVSSPKVVAVEAMGAQ